ncbi:MAG: DUF805 domain-containing protein [Pseudomonadaceae bacterium]|nr:DUF805 domain-containing protein [Pseudomonadaceae bacterium]
MPQSKYKIVFKGELMPDAVLDEVKDQLAKLFKSDHTKINALFDGGPIALKRDLTDEEADKYLAALQRTGAKVYKEADLAASLSLVATDEHTGPATIAAAPVDSSHMDCPKCGHQQVKAAICAACGIVIDKFAARQAELVESAPAAAAVSAPAAASNPLSATPYAPPTANVAEVLPEFAELKLFGVDGRIGRLRYLAWSLAMTVVAMIIGGIGLFAAYGLSGNTSLLAIVGGLAAAVVFIAMIVIGIQIGVKRLHDIGWSGWLLLINLIPAVGSVFAIIMLVVPGSTGANRFGAPPPPNSRGVKVLASLWLLVPVLGILAAIAIPQYQGYVDRAHEAQSSTEQSESADYVAEPADAAAPYADDAETAADDAKAEAEADAEFEAQSAADDESAAKAANDENQ